MTFFHPRRLSTSSTCSASSSDEQAVSPDATTLQHYSRCNHHHRSRPGDKTARPGMTSGTSTSTSSSSPPSRRESGASERSCEGLTAGDCKDLWRCMLELQEVYNCYHSTRIDLAVDAGDAGVNLMPNRFIIDTLNESVIGLLPEEGWTKLDRCFRQGSKTCREIH